MPVRIDGLRSRDVRVREKSETAVPAEDGSAQPRLRPVAGALRERTEPERAEVVPRRRDVVPLWNRAESVGVE